ncbi:hypothetical protein BGW42_007294, partial [Actinomortierella wolfii]
MSRKDSPTVATTTSSSSDLSTKMLTTRLGVLALDDSPRTDEDIIRDIEMASKEFSSVWRRLESLQYLLYCEEFEDAEYDNPDFLRLQQEKFEAQCAPFEQRLKELDDLLGRLEKE